jgi:hypothetical protein
MKDLPKPKFEGQKIAVPFIESIPPLDDYIEIYDDGTVKHEIKFGTVVYTANKNLEWE